MFEVNDLVKEFSSKKQQNKEIENGSIKENSRHQNKEFKEDTNNIQNKLKKTDLFKKYYELKRYREKIINSDDKGQYYILLKEYTILRNKILIRFRMEKFPIKRDELDKEIDEIEKIANNNKDIQKEIPK